MSVPGTNAGRRYSCSASYVSAPKSGWGMSGMLERPWTRRDLAVGGLGVMPRVSWVGWKVLLSIDTTNCLVGGRKGE